MSSPLLPKLAAASVAGCLALGTAAAVSRHAAGSAHGRLARAEDARSAATVDLAAGGLGSGVELGLGALAAGALPGGARAGAGRSTASGGGLAGLSGLPAGPAGALGASGTVQAGPPAGPGSTVLPGRSGSGASGGAGGATGGGAQVGGPPGSAGAGPAGPGLGGVVAPVASAGTPGVNPGNVSTASVHAQGGFTVPVPPTAGASKELCLSGTVSADCRAVTVPATPGTTLQLAWSGNAGAQAPTLTVGGCAGGVSATVAGLTPGTSFTVTLDGRTLRRQVASREVSETASLCDR